MVPTLPTSPVPWYTALTLITLVLMVAYLWWTIFKYALSGVAWTVKSAGRTFESYLSAICGYRLNSHGGARWATTWDVKRAHLEKPGHIALGRLRRTIIREPNGGHIALFGPPRSRKSWGLIMPAIENFGGSLVASDMRGELCERTRRSREQYGMVHRFDPAGSESISMNLLDNIRWNSTYASGDVDRIVHHLLMSSGDNDAAQAVPLLRALIWYAHTEGWGNFPAILAFMTDATRTLKDKLQALLACPLRVVQAGARSTLDLSDRSRQWAWMKCREPLDIFDDEVITSRTTTSDVLLHDLLDAVEVQTLYLCMAFSDIWRLNVFLGAFTELLCALVSAPGRVRRHPLALILDEAANLGTLRELERGMSYLQGSGAQVLLTFQNTMQVQKVYGPDSPLISSCANIVHYTPAPGDMFTASAISNLLGPTTTIAWGSTSVTTSGFFGGTRETQSQGPVARPLLFPREILEQDADTAFVFIQHQPPIFCDKLGITTRAPSVRIRRMLARQIPLLKTCAATGLLLFSLWPLRPYLGDTPTTLARTETDGVHHAATIPLSLPTTPPATESVPPAPAQPSTGLFAPQPVPLPASVIPRDPPTSPGWTLWYHNPSGPQWGIGSTQHGTAFHPPAPVARGYYSTGAACQEALAMQFGPQLARLIQLGQGGKNVAVGKVERSPNKYHWEQGFTTNGQVRAVYEAWCAEAQTTATNAKE
jgi:type IV secretory pathway TraG/TraD family ATPase VirD4